MQHTDPKLSGNPTFSVIMPCYNSETYVRGAVDSLIDQTWQNWELIAINDGSADHTLKILNAYAEHDSRIRVWSKENGGYISAVNCGLEKIRGDYFLLMGSDDALGRNLFSELALCAQDRQPDCIAFRSILVRDGKALGAESITSFSGKAELYDTTLADYIRTYPEHAAIFSTRDTSKCFKRSLLGDLRYFGRYGFDADGIFSMLLCHRAHSFASIPVDGYYWTLRGDSLSGRKSFFAQDLDRVENWNAFYSRLLTLDAVEITATEKEYLYYFLNITQNTWKSSRPFLSAHRTISQAVRLIRDISEKTETPLSLGAESRLLLRSPVLWKLCALSPVSPWNTVQAIKKLLKKS